MRNNFIYIIAPPLEMQEGRENFMVFRQIFRQARGKFTAKFRSNFVVSYMRWPYNNRKDIGTFAIMECRIERAEGEAKQTGCMGVL